ncbi:Nucleosomal histone H3-Lys79 methylase [Coemansia guatemalensis]|uniref:Histone-lysine N-methyltransferase, H3 lysine-79 specific n=1 Tax=Coemansia guatemalensis TaxID=2761395 RepID=A0A9W8HTL2_9FUNG|nr:Nucleosomal histone H3-Lys79 methylase [Coemansia guatemalensis]
MDLFFGASKGAASSQQTVSIRVEERGRARKDNAAGGPLPAPHRARTANTSPDRAVREADIHRTQDSRARRRKQQAQHDMRAERRAAQRSVVRRAARQLLTSEGGAMSPRDSVIVNANREHVGSLPSSPRPRKPASRIRSVKPSARVSPRPDSSPTAGTLSPAHGIGRCFSVPAHGGPVSASDLSSLPVQSTDKAVVSSADAVRQSEAQYEDFFQWDDTEPRVESIELHLPATGASEVFSLLAPKSHERESEPRDEYLPVNDLMSTVHAIATYLVDSPPFYHAVCGDKEHGIMRCLERARNRRSGRAFVDAVRDFNRLLDAERDADRVQAAFAKGAIPSDLAVHVIEQIYNRIVAPTVDMLRQYKAFSNNVYGEILPTLISEFIERTAISHESVFIDLGCGIGNVVLQVAAQTGCSATGVEIMEVPASFANRQAQEFERRMRLYRMDHGTVRICHADFCESPDVQLLLPTADVVLVNNYAFDSTLNQNLLQMFLDLKEGTKIISLKPFVTPDYKISARNIYSPESIMSVRRYPYWSKCVSWTDSGGEYFVQTIDRSRVKAFLAKRGMF